MPEVLVQFSISLPPEMIHEIDELARVGYRTRRKQIWLMLEWALQHIRQEANEEHNRKEETP